MSANMFCRMGPIEPGITKMAYQETPQLTKTRFYYVLKTFGKSYENVLNKRDKRVIL